LFDNQRLVYTRSDKGDIVPENARPKARIVANLNQVTVGELVVLDGSGSSDPDGDPLSFAWTQKAGPQIVMSSAQGASIRFTPLLPGDYVFSLVVHDGIGAQGEEVSIHVVKPQAFVAASVTKNRMPVAKATTTQKIAHIGETVRLDASSSKDPDLSPNEVLAYAWTAPEGITLSGSDAASAEFTPMSEGIYSFQLVVNDGQLDSKPATIKVKVVLNKKPVARIKKLTGKVNVLLTLDGSGSSDADHYKSPLGYTWLQSPDDPIQVILFRNLTRKPQFTALMAGEYHFILTVNDGELSSDSVTTTVKVK
jgi:hypothetical protein